MQQRVVIRGFRCRLYPVHAQAERLEQWSGALRYVWNRLLEQQQHRYATDKTFMWRKELQAAVMAIKADPERPWIKDVPAHALLQVAANMDKAFRRFIADRKAGRLKPGEGFPKPKKKFVREAGIYCVNQGTHTADDLRSVVLPKLGATKVRGWRDVAGRIMGSTITRRGGGGWFLSVQIEGPAPEAPAPAVASLGVDLGIKRLATIYDGVSLTHVDNIRPLKRRMKRLKRMRRHVSRRRKGSARRRLAARRVGTLHRKVADQRRNALHQLTHALTAKAQVIKVEDLNVKGLQRGFHSRAIADVGLGIFLNQIAYKADWRGRDVIKVDRFYPSSQTCSCCNAIHKEMKRMLPTLRCDCGAVLDRDDNAAINIFWYGEERRNRRMHATTDVEIGDHGFAQVPIGEASISAFHQLC